LLLRNPGREFYVSELVASLMHAPIPALEVTANGRLRDVSHQLVVSGFVDAGPVLDAQAKAQYKRRLNDLRQDLNEAEQFNDLDRAVKAQDEMHAIAQYLASAVGLGGRDRKTSSEAERARSAVTKRIKKAIQKIGDAIPSLGRHLTARIKTGYFFSYNPHPDRPVAWKF
jgi:non-specific serine/threonine protein kinase